MSVGYAIQGINQRLTGVVTAVGQSGNGFLKLQSATGATVSNIQLNQPCGTVSGGILTLTGSLLDPSAAGGTAVKAVMTDTNGVVMVSGLTVGTSATNDIVLSPTNVITAGNVIQLLSAQITGN